MSGNSTYNGMVLLLHTLILPNITVWSLDQVLLLGECIALWGEPDELSIRHHVYIFMQYVNSKLAKLRY